MRIKYVTKRTGKTVAYDGRYIARAVRLAAVSAGDYDEDMVEQVMQHVESHLSAWRRKPFRLSRCRIWWNVPCLRWDILIRQRRISSTVWIKKRAEDYEWKDGNPE